MPPPGHQHQNGVVNPFEPAQSRMSEYTAQEVATLKSRLEKQLGPEYISSRQGPSGQKVHYLAAEKCIMLANSVFGFNGWSSAIRDVTVDFVDENPTHGKISLGLSVIVRVTLKDGSYHEDIGYGHIENCKGKAAAFEKAKKEGTTDAMKRALRNFGNILGNCVYDKEYLARVTKMKVVPTKWDPENLHRHADYAPKKQPDSEPLVKQEPDTAAKSDPEPTLAAANQPGTVSDELDDEFGVADFDEADFSIAENAHPDEVALDGSNSPAKPAATNGSTSNATKPAAPNPAMAPPTLRAGAQPNTSAPMTPQTAGPQTRSQATATTPVAAVLSTIEKDLGDYVHDPKVGFVSSRGAMKLMETENVQQLAPFDPRIGADASSLRRTHGIDHSTSKPLTRPRIGQASPATNAPGKGNFVQPHLDPNRKIGMPGVASPMQNRHTYRPPTQVGKRPADDRGALHDVTAASVNVPGETTGGDGKRVKVDGGGGGEGGGGGAAAVKVAGR